MSEGGRNEYKALLDVVMEQRKFVVGRLGQAADSLARFASEQEGQARLLTNLSAEVGKLNPKVDAVVQRLDDIDRRIEAVSTDVRRANSEIILRGNQIINALDGAIRGGADLHALEERLSDLERRFE